MFWKKKKRHTFGVAVHLNGRHPYLKSTELDYPSRDVELIVPATDWNDAERQALDAAANLPDKWSWRVTSIARIKP